MGLLYLALIPPLHTPDGNYVLVKAYLMGRGVLLPDASQGPCPTSPVPEALLDVFTYTVRDVIFHPERKVTWERYAQAWNMRVDAGQCRMACYGSHSIYPPVSFLPQTAGIFLARQCTDNVLLWVYAARLANFLVWLAVMYWALRLMPWGKSLFLLLACTPMHFFLTATISCDALTIALAMFWVALTAHYAAQGRAPSSWGYCGLVLAALGVCASKLLYFPLVVLVLLLPWAKEGRPRDLCGKAAVLASSLGFVWLWSSITAPLQHIPRLLMQDTVVFQEKYAASVARVLEHPFDYLELLWRTTTHEAASYLHGFVGQLGWMDTHLPPAAYWLWGAALVAALYLADAPGRVLGMRRRLVLLAAAISCYVLLQTAEYIFWTPLDSAVIEGTQGRHFLPFALPLLLPLGWPLLAARGAVRSGVAAGLRMALPLLLLLGAAAVAGRYFF